MSQVRYASVEERLIANSVMSHADGCIDLNGEWTFCWIWLKNVDKRASLGGYGRMNFREGGKHVSRKPHRVSWEEFIGAVKREKLTKYDEIDHVCHVRSCINPSHLRKVTHAENMLNLRSHHFAKQSRSSSSEDHNRV